MDQTVSKLRTKKSRSREKQANRSATKPPLRKHPAVGLLIAASLWLASVLVLVIGYILQRQWPANRLLLLAGDSSLLLVSLLAVGIYIQIVRPEILRQNSRLLALALTCLVPLVITGGLLYFAENGVLFPLETTIFLLPFALPPLLATILFDGRLGIAVGTWSTLAFAIMSGRSFTVVMAGVIATVMTSSIARNVRTRSKVVRMGMVIGVAQIACVFAATVQRDMPQDITVIIHQAGACVLSGVLSAIAALLILPAFEATFHITTNITLLELSDLGHPLLQRLAIEAPGTYHHSLVVSNLARAAADAIGANSLLARVCSSCAWATGRRAAKGTKMSATTANAAAKALRVTARRLRPGSRMARIRLSSLDGRAMATAAAARGARKEPAIAKRWPAYTDAFSPAFSTWSSQARSRSTRSRVSASQAKGLNQCRAQATQPTVCVR